MTTSSIPPCEINASTDALRDGLARAARVLRGHSGTIADGHFRCEMCGEVFPIEDGDEDVARAEAESKGVDPDDSGLVCDACYATTPWGRSDFRPPIQVTSPGKFAARSRRRVDGAWVTTRTY